MAFRYYQESKNSKWLHIVDTPEALKDLIVKQVPLVSILSVKDPIEGDNELDEHLYSGDFYVDIDCPDISEAIVSAQDFDLKLKELKATGYKVFLSGKKGFHFIIPFKNFYSGRMTKHLPLIYKEMALELYVEGIDMAVYNEGKPRLLRTPNVQRADNNKYKVEIDPDILLGLTEEKYAELTSSPKPLSDDRDVKESIQFKTLFETCKAKVIRKLRSLKNIDTTPSEELVKTLGSNQELPECINRLIEKGDTKAGTNFNQATMQFASFMVNAEVKDWEAHARRMAKNVKSSSYNSEISRFKELKKMYRYAQGNVRMQFAKQMLFSVIEPCGNCAICSGHEEAKDEEGNNSTASILADIEETSHGYYTGYGKMRRQISTFTLELVNKFTSVVDDKIGAIRVGTNAKIQVNGAVRDSAFIPEEAWQNVRDFGHAIKGRDSAHVFLGTENDLKKLHHKLFSGADVPEVHYVKSVGMHRHTVNGKTILVYVEPDFSVSSTRERNTHECWGDIAAPPRIREAKYPDAEDPKLREAINKMMKCNSPFVTASLISWMAACHIKVQLTMKSNQFPLINLSGNAGSGKTTMGQLFSGLHAVDYMLEHSPVSLQGTTPWAVAQYASSSESTPRLIEEFNQGEIPPHKYDQFSGMFKAAWNAQTYAKGGMEKSKIDGKVLSGVKLQEAKISAPLVVMSEQAADRPALRQRMINVNVNRKDHEDIEIEDNYFWLEDRPHILHSLARAMVWQSLTTHPDTVHEWMQSHRSEIPRGIDSRPRYSYQVLLTGADFFQKTLQAIGLDDSFCASVGDRLRKAILDNLSDSIESVRKEKLTTEVVLVLNEMALQAESGRSTATSVMDNVLVQGDHYIKTSTHLYIYTKVCHSKYLRWSRLSGTRVILRSVTQFEALLKQEDFYVETAVHPDIRDGRVEVAKLDLAVMNDRGINITMFEGDDEL